MDFNQKIITAGVYVQVAGCFLFQVGPTKSGETLGVVRLGGHREGNETGWECAAREAFEEASLSVKPLSPPMTYWGNTTDEWELQPGEWRFYDNVAPILVTKRNEEYITPIYLGYSHDEPKPSSEAKALLLLRPEDIHQMVTQPMTLGQYLERGGNILLREELPGHLIMEPFVHLRWLYILLQLHPQITHIVR